MKFLHQLKDKQSIQFTSILKKAFDSIPHAELLHKLWTIGITRPLWFWFKSYLTNPKHYVNINEHTSQSLPVLSGVPQGSIVGPLLFLVYINDLPNSIDSASVYLFADDTKFIKSILANLANTSDPLLQSDIDLLVAWCKLWKLSLNADKCAAIRFSLSPKTPLPSVYRVDETIIKFLPCHRDLGIVASSELSWSNLYDLICSKAYRTFHLIRRSLSSSSSVATRKQLYLSLVKSKLSYCCQLWRPRLIKDIRNFERIQRCATKFILQDYSSDYKTRLLSLNLVPLMQWYELQDMIFLVKCLKNPMDNLIIHDHVEFVTSTTHASSNGKLRHKFCRLSTTGHFYFNRIVRLWNLFPWIDPGGVGQGPSRT